MKKAILLVILCAVFMTGCDEYDMTLKITYQPETAESITASEEVSCEVTEKCSDTIPSELPETFSAEIIEIQETVTVSEEILFTESECEEQQEPESTEIPEETASKPVTTEAEAAVRLTETESVMLTEFVTETETVPEFTEFAEIIETETIPETEPVKETDAVTELETVPELSDYEKAQIVYEYMLENGHDTCVNYACQTYEKCLEIGLPCYIVWTDAGLYGHTANTVCVNDIWFIMDTQAGGFLESNYGFTEVVSMDCEHIADGDMLSNYSYQELFQE